MRAQAEASGARQDGIAHCVWDASAFDGEHLGDEEGVAPRFDIEVSGIHAFGDRHSRDCVRSEEGQSDAPTDAGRAEFAQKHAQWMASIESLVSIAESHEQWHGVGSARDETDDVQRGFVCPMHVLDNQDRWSARQPRQQSRGQTVGRFVVLQELLDLTTGGRSDVMERTEGPWCEQRVAGTPEHFYRFRPLCQETTDERRLADTGFATDEDDATAVLPGYRSKPLRQLGKLAFAFQQLPRGVITSIVHSRSPHRRRRNPTACGERGLLFVNSILDLRPHGR